MNIRIANYRLDMTVSPYQIAKDPYLLRFTTIQEQERQGIRHKWMKTNGPSASI